MAHPTAKERAAQILKELEDDLELYKELNQRGAITGLLEVDLRAHPKELRVPVTFVTAAGTLTVSALVDSGATINTILPILARRLGLKVMEDTIPRCLVNADGSRTQECTQGHVKLSVTANGQTEKMEFILINSSINLLLGFSWLAKFEPSINWKVATLDERFWPMVCNIYKGLSNEEASSSQAVKPATSSQAWGPSPRKEGDVMFQPSAPLPHSAVHTGAVLDIEDLPQDMPSAEDIHYWMHGDDNEDNSMVHRMLDLPEDAKEPEETEED